MALARPAAAGSDDLDAAGRHRDLILLALIVAFGIALRLPGLRESIWFDEAFTWLQTRDLDVIRTLVLTSRDTYPPLHNLLTLPFLALFGQGETALRLPALVCSVLAIPAAHWLGTIASGRIAGLVAALLMALAPFAIEYAQEARMYGLFLLAATLHAGTTLAWLRAPSWLRGLAMIGTGAMLLYAHPYGPFVVVSAAAGGPIAIAAERAGWRRALLLLALNAIIALSFIPWLIAALRVARQLVRDGFWIARPNLASAFAMVREVAGGPIGLGLLAAGLILALVPVRRTAASARPAIIVLACLALGPLLIGFTISQVTTPILLSRYLICCLPAFIGLAAIGYGRIAFMLGSATLPLLLAGGLSAAAVSQLRYPLHYEDWRSATRYLADNVRPDDCVVLSRPEIGLPLDYYRFVRPACTFDSLERAVERADGGKRLIAVVSHGPQNVAGVKAALPGDWTSLLRFGSGVTIIVREPTAP